MLQSSSEDKASSRRYALCVGIGTYTNLVNRNLRYAVADAEVIAKRLAERGDFAVTCLTEPTQTTKATLEKAVEDLLSGAERQAEDLIVLYFSCHGDVNKTENTFLLLPSNATRQANGVFDQSTVIDISDLARWFSRAKTRNIVLLLDVCHSGGAGVALQHFKLHLDSDLNIFIIGAARQDRIAEQSSKLEHGIFTHCLLRAFGQPPTKDGWLTISQIQEFVSDDISWFSKKDHPLQIQVSSFYVNPLLPLVRNPGYPELSPLPPVWSRDIPSRNSFFTEQDEYLSKLFNGLHNEQRSLTQPYAIGGLGGIGKTQLALEYVYRYRQYYRAVFWGRADNDDALNTTFVKIAHLLGLLENYANQKMAIEVAKDWLADRSDWLLVLDNANDLALVSKFLPSVFRGHLLLTTRAQATGEMVRKFNFEIEAMRPEIGALLLLRRAGRIKQQPDRPGTLKDASPSDVAVARELSKEMGGLPLALDQAGAFIQEKSCSLQHYYGLYQNQTQRPDLLKIRGGLRQDYPESVATTWSLSFQEVEACDAAAVDLLRLCAFLAPDSIAEKLITQGGIYLGKALRPFVANELRLDNAIAELLKFSLVKRDSEKQCLSVHQLVQEIVRDSLPPQERKEWSKRVFLAIDTLFSIRHLGSSNPAADVDYWQTYEVLIPHVLLCSDRAEQTSVDSLRLARLLTKAGMYLQNRGHIAEVERYYERASELHANYQPPALVRSLGLGPIVRQSARAILVSESQLNLANLYYEQGEYEKAERLLQQVRRLYEHEQRAPDQRLAEVWNDLGELYRRWGRYTDAEEFLFRAKDIGEIRTAKQNKRVCAAVLNHLATLYRDLAQYREAEYFYRRSLEIREDLYGSQHLIVSNIQTNWATLYRLQGKYKKAEALYLQALELRHPLLGASHPDTATSQNELATLYRLQGKYKKAEALYLQALELRQMLLGASHPDTATSQNDLAALHFRQSRYVEAQEGYLQALTVRERRLGPEHPDTAESLNGLAILYGYQERYEQAEAYCRRALEIREKQLGSEHPNTVTSLCNLALLYQAQGRYTRAEQFFQHALSVCRQHLEPNHPAAQVVRKGYAHFLRAMGRDDEAKHLEEHP